MNNQSEAKAALMKAWPHIIEECCQVLGSELHYQAMIYHCLRQYGKVPVDQIGMNVKMAVANPQSPFFKEQEGKRVLDYQGEFEPIPDIVLFKSTINTDWRRRNNENTLTHMLMAIEIKASEQKNSRLGPGDIEFDINKLDALRFEVRRLGGSVVPVMIVIDTAPKTNERMVPKSLERVQEFAKNKKVEFFYVSPDKTGPSCFF